MIKKLFKKVLPILLLLPLLIQASPQQLHTLKMIDIPLVFNLDSMENVTKLKDKSGDEYLIDLLTIERSRDLLKSVYRGRFCQEIDSISKTKNFKFGILFAQYMKAKMILEKGNGNLSELMINTIQSEKEFEQLQDTSAIITINLAMAHIYSRLQRALFPENFEANSDIRKESKQSYLKALAYIEKAELFNRNRHSLNDSILIVYNKMQIRYASFPDIAYLDSMNKICDGIIAVIDKHTKLRYLLPSVYNTYGNALRAAYHEEEALNYYKKGLSFYAHPENSSIADLNYNIGSSYLAAGKFDDAFVYLMEAMKIDKAQHNYPRNLSTKYLSALAYYYKMKGDYKKSLQYMEEFVSVDELIALTSRANDFLQLESEAALREKDLEKQAIEVKQKNTMLIIWCTIGLLSLVSFFMIYFLRSRNKLNKAYHEITMLQKVREKFFTIVAHDLRSPINSYQGLAGTVSYLIKKKQYDDIEKIATRIDETGISLNLLLNNLLNWSLSQQKQLNVSVEHFQPEEIFSTVVPAYKEFLIQKNLTLIETYQSDISLYTSKNSFSIILRNLLDNAIKNALPQTSIELISKLENGIYNLSVSNHTQIDADQLLSIQQLFASKDDWQPGAHGMGIGLVMVQQCVRMMNANMMVINDQGVLTFSVQFKTS